MKNILVTINKNDISTLTQESFKSFSHLRGIESVKLIVRKQSSFLDNLESFNRDFQETTIDSDIQKLIYHFDTELTDLKKLSYDVVSSDDFPNLVNNINQGEFDVVITWSSNDRSLLKGLSRVSTPIMSLPIQSQHNGGSILYPTEKADIPKESITFLNEYIDPYLGSELVILHYYKTAEWYLRETVYTTDEVDILLENRSIVDRRISSILDYRKEELLMKGLSLNRDVNVKTIKREIHNSIKNQLIAEIKYFKPKMIILDSEVYSDVTKTMKMLSAMKVDSMVIHFPKSFNSENKSILKKVFQSFA